MWRNKLNLTVVREHEESEPINPPLSVEEILILQQDFKDRIDVIPKLDGNHRIRSNDYVGYVILPDHIISIRPKITNASLINMMKYALNLPELYSEQDYIADEDQDFFEVLIRFLLKNVELMLERGLYQSYVELQENINYVRGKILFKEHVMANRGRNDRVFCQFSELTADVLENRIIKYTLYHLLHTANVIVDDRINRELVVIFKRFDQVELVPLTSDIFEFVNYTPLNEYYKPVLSLCQLILLDSSLNIERIGERKSFSFLIGMDKLFEKFVGNLLISHFGNEVVKLQTKSYPELKDKKLIVLSDIILFHNGTPSVILDTKYRELESKPKESEVAQMVLYSISTGIKQCILVYGGYESSYREYKLKEDINLGTLVLDLGASSKGEFEKKCLGFVAKISTMLEVQR